MLSLDMASISIPEGELTSFDLPAICLVTGAREQVEVRTVRFTFTPLWIPLAIPGAAVACIVVPALFPLLLGLPLLAVFATRKVRGQLPFSPRGYRLWKVSSGALRVTSTFASLFLLVVLLSRVFDPGPLPWGLLAGLAIVPAVAYALAVRFGVAVRNVRRGVVRLRIPSSEAARTITHHLTAGAARSSAPHA